MQMAVSAWITTAPHAENQQNTFKQGDHRTPGALYHITSLSSLNSNPKFPILYLFIYIDRMLQRNLPIPGITFKTCTAPPITFQEVSPPPLLATLSGN